MKHMEVGLKSQEDAGFAKSDTDDVRRLISDTNILLLSITIFASTLHMLFEFLAFKSEVNFWNENTDLTGLSVRSLFTDLLSQIVIMLFLHEEGASLLVTIPAFVSILIALWKCQKAAKFKFVKGRFTATRLVKDDDGLGGEDAMTAEVSAAVEEVVWWSWG
tara:strand:- start:99 stop:584 length:486 start_codon:yes stop_codon:yes gene_type:complete